MFIQKLDTNTPMLVAASQRKRSFPPFLDFVIWVVIFCISQLIISLITGVLIPRLTGTASAPLAPINLYCTAVTVAFAVLYCLKAECRSSLSMGFVKHHAVIEYVVGFAVGLSMFGLVMLFCKPFGAFKLSLTPNLTSLIPSLILFLGGFVVQGFSEEVLCRSYLLNSLCPKTGAPIAVAISSIAFSLLHIGNSAVSLVALVNIALFGAFAGIYFIRRGNIWGVAAIHTAWNFAEGNIFGVRVSGVNLSTSVFTAAADESLALLNGGEFGAENGLAVTLVLLIGIALIVIIPASHKKEGLS